MTKQPNLQDNFLNAARKQRQEVSIFLINGIKMTGHIQSFDNYVILMSSSNKGPQLVYKHAVSTIQPGPNFRFAPLSTEGSQEDTPVA